MFLNQNDLQRGQQRGQCKSEDSQFLNNYLTEEKKKRTLDKTELKTIDGFLINENIEYFIANLKNIVEKEIPLEEEIDEDDKPIDEEEEDEDEEETLSVSLKFHEFKQNPEKNEIELVYQVKEKLAAYTSTSNIRVMIDLGLNSKNHMIVNVKKLEGEHLYYKKIVSQIRKGFGYCLINKTK